MELPPPPPGLTAESSIRIDGDGRFWHDGQLVEHPGLAAAFASWLAVEPATGRYVLRNAVNWCYVTVERTPFVVRAVTEHAGGGLELTLSDGTREPLDTATLRLGDDDVPECRVKDSRFPARFSRTAAYALLEHARPCGDGDGDGFVVELGGELVPLVRRPS